MCLEYDKLLELGIFLLTEDIKNEFYESDVNSYFRIKYESEFYYILKHLNKLLFPILLITKESGRIINGKDLVQKWIAMAM
jgi:hypothetical protein